MVNVDDMVPDFEVAKVGKERRSHRLSPVTNPSLFVEEVGLCVHLQPSIGKSKPARQLAGRHEHRDALRRLSPVDGHRTELVLL